MAEVPEPAPGVPCSNIWNPDCTGAYILYTEGEMAGLLECSRCGYTPNGADYTEICMTETQSPASAMFTDGIALTDIYPAFDNHLMEAASWYQLGDLDKAGAYVRNIAENLHAHAGHASRSFLQLVVHLVKTHAPVGCESSQTQTPDQEVIRLERRIAAYESATRQLFGLVPSAKSARIDHDLTVALDAANAAADRDTAETGAS